MQQFKTDHRQEAFLWKGRLPTDVWATYIKLGTGPGVPQVNKFEQVHVVRGRGIHVNKFATCPFPLNRQD